MEEIWKEYPLNTNYTVSNLGRVKNKTGHLMALSQDKKGYLFIRTSKNGVKTTSLIHRMVMITFCYIDDYNITTVDHINGIRKDNRLENLKWCTLKENISEKLYHRQMIDTEITRLVNLYGYEETLKKIKNIY